MRLRSNAFIWLLLSLLLGSVVLAQVEKATQKTVYRAKRPTFERKDWDGVFFENLFTEALKGERPKSFENGKKPPLKTTKQPVTDVGKPNESGWSALIDRSALEDEVKRLQILLNEQVTTPAKFSTDHNQARHTFSLLSMCFGMISQYDGDVRWKSYAASAQVAFARAAANSRTGSQQAYSNAKRCKEDLADLIRGGSFPEQPEVASINDWAAVVDRTVIMQRLEFSLGQRLKESTSSERDFQSQSDVVLHEAHLIAAMGRILASPEMIDSNDESYRALAQGMSTAATSLISAVKVNDYRGVNSSLNAIGQSCDACHEEWR